MSEGPQYDIGMLTMDENREYTTILNEDYLEIQPQLSPDGRWLAYWSNEGDGAQIYVRPFPVVDQEVRWQGSTDGGILPRWSPDGKELFYIARDSTPTTVMLVEVETEPTFGYGTPRIVFSGSYIGLGIGIPYDVHPEGDKFLMMKPPPIAEEASSAGDPRKIIIVTNWFEELKERVPLK